MRVVAVLVCAGLWSTLVTAAEPAAGEQGVWQRHALRFQYQGFTTIYSCDGLVSKLQVLLKAAGARNAKVRAGSCTEIGGRPDRFAAATLVYESLAAARADDSAAVPAHWRTLRLADNRPRDLSPGDCELVEQFRDQVLRKTFATRNPVDRLVCIPHQLSPSFTFDVEVLSAR